MGDYPLWHGTRAPIDQLDPLATRDGGLHLGTRAQAEMRNARVLYKLRCAPVRVTRLRDRGNGWAKRIAAARRRGAEAIIYLNRYEGLPTERILELHAQGQLAELDSLSDRAFARRVPEARDSLILLPGTAFEVIATEYA